MTPAFLLGTLFVIAYAALLHLWQGRNTGDLVVYLIACSIGFSGGQLLGLLIHTPIGEIGQLHLFEATIGAWLALGAAFVMRQSQ